MEELESNAQNVSNDENVEQNESETQVGAENKVKKVKLSDPPFLVALRNIRYKFSYQSVLIYSFALAIVSLLGYLFFNRQYSLFSFDPEIVSSCFIMIVFFLVFLIFFTTVFLTSLVLNIMRVIREKNEKM